MLTTPTVPPYPVQDHLSPALLMPPFPPPPSHPTPERAVSLRIIPLFFTPCVPLPLHVPEPCLATHFLAFCITAVCKKVFTWEVRSRSEHFIRQTSFSIFLLKKCLTWVAAPSSGHPVRPTPKQFSKTEPRTPAQPTQNNFPKQAVPDKNPLTQL